MKTTLKNFISVILLWGCISNQESIAQSAYAVSADAMNVFYIGMDNPVTIAVAGIPSDKISASMNNGTLTGEQGKYIARINGGRETEIKVFVQTETGEKDSVGTVKFRIKPVPSPVPVFAGKRGADIIKKELLMKSGTVTAELLDFNFDLQFPVVSFDVSTAVISGKDTLEVTESSVGNMFTEKQKALVSRIKPGGKVYIEKVKVKKPGGQVVDIGNINLKVIE